MADQMDTGEQEMGEGAALISSHEINEAGITNDSPQSPTHDTTDGSLKRKRDASDVQSLDENAAKRKRKSNYPDKTQVTEEYLDLLNESIVDARRPLEYGRENELGSPEDLQPEDFERQADPRPSRPSELPIAFEVSDDCRRELDAAADKILNLQWQQEFKIERKHYGKYWLLNRDHVNWLYRLDRLAINVARSKSSDEERLADKKSSAEEMELSETEAVPASAVPTDAEAMTDGEAFTDGEARTEKETFQSSLLRAHRLLILEVFLNLSSDVFMNTEEARAVSEAHKLDKTYAKQPHEPALFASAFIELYQIVESLTQRLVLASLFQAQMRLRTGRRLHAKASVLPQDVLNAVDILGLPRNSEDWWAVAPARLGLKGVEDGDLEMHENNQGTESNNTVSIATLPSEIQGPAADEHQSVAGGREAPQSADPQANNQDGEPNDNASTAALPGKVQGLTSNGRQSIAGAHKAPQIIESETEEENAAEEEELDELDANASLKHERSLWDALQMEVPASYGTPFIEHSQVLKRRVDTVDWRTKSEFASPWELFGRKDPFARASLPLSRHSRGSLRIRTGTQKSTQERLGEADHGEADHGETDHGETDHGETDYGEPSISETTAKAKLVARKTPRARGTGKRPLGLVQRIKPNELDVEAGAPETTRGESSKSQIRSDRQRSPPTLRRRPASTKYAFEPGDGVLRPEDLPSDSSDDYQP